MQNLPDPVRAKAELAGAAGWLEGLPGLVTELADRWHLTPGPAFPDATEAYVVAVTRADGTPAVLKLLVPRPGDAARHEITVLRLTAGEGCARLLEFDESRHALLVERLGPAMSGLSLPQPERLAVLCDLAAAVWRPLTPSTPSASGPSGSAPRLPAPCFPAPPSAPHCPASPSPASRFPASPSAPHCPASRFPASPSVAPPSLASPSAAPPSPAGLPSGAGKAAHLAEQIRRNWDELGQPCTRAAVDQALAAAERRRRAHDPARAVLNHGDVHQWNALRAGDGFKLVDPDGLWAEPEYDLGVLMREDPVELMAGDPWDRARWLAARTGTDPVAIWEWGVIERVNTGLVLTAVGLQPVAGQMLEAADALAA